MRGARRVLSAGPGLWWERSDTTYVTGGTWEPLTSELKHQTGGSGEMSPVMSPDTWGPSPSEYWCCCGCHDCAPFVCVTHLAPAWESRVWELGTENREQGAPEADNRCVTPAQSGLSCWPNECFKLCQCPCVSWASQPWHEVRSKLDYIPRCKGVHFIPYYTFNNWWQVSLGQAYPAISATPEYNSYSYSRV